jgi:RecB family exonuclease
MDVLAFDAVAHRYTYGDRELISVTQALTEAGFIDTRWYSDEAAQRGTAVHAAVQRFHDCGEVATDDACAPFFDAYLSFQMQAGFDVHATEERICDPVMGYAGTLDLRGRFRSQASGVDVVDIKTGAIPAWVGYQTAAYARCIDGTATARARRWALNLRADGTYRLEPLTKRTDTQVFLAALTVAQAKRGWL